MGHDDLLSVDDARKVTVRKTQSDYARGNESAVRQSRRARPIMGGD
jgi:hypothetical protein